MYPREEWPKQYFTLPNGISSPDTFSRVYLLLSPKAFHVAFIRLDKGRQTFLPEDVVVIYGKTLCDSACRTDVLKPLHIVSA